MAIGNVIIELRNESNLSQQKLAEAIGVSQSTIAQIEKNRNEATASTIRKLADFFEVSADYLLELENEWGVKQFRSSEPLYSKTEQGIINDYRQLNPACQKLVQDTIKTLLASSGVAQSNNKNIS